MSKLKVDEIRDTSDSLDIPPAIPGLNVQLPQAWVNFNGTGTVTINDSFNVSSITDNGTGDYTVNFTNDLANTNYAWIGSCQDANDLGGSGINHFSTDAKTISAFRVRVFTYSNAATDTDDVNVAIFGGI